jgi:hypothetical protein
MAQGEAAYSVNCLILKVKAVFSSETSVPIILHGVKYQKTCVCNDTAVRTSHFPNTVGIFVKCTLYNTLALREKHAGHVTAIGFHGYTGALFVSNVRIVLRLGLSV